MHIYDWTNTGNHLVTHIPSEWLQLKSDACGTTRGTVKKIINIAIKVVVPEAQRVKGKKMVEKAWASMDDKASREAEY